MVFVLFYRLETELIFIRSVFIEQSEFEKQIWERVENWLRH